MRLKILVSILCLLLCFSCKKDFSRHAAVITGSVDKPTATANGRLIDVGKIEISDHGFCWDTLGTPSIGASNLKLGKIFQVGDFSGQLTDLRPSKVYYLRTFVSYSNDDVIYGDMISFRTPNLPTLSTDTVSNITESEATSGGNITEDGGSPVTARGVCWNTSPNPDLTNNWTFDSVGSGKFICQLTGLQAGTNYYVRAYATTLYGTAFGNQVSFSSSQIKSPPVVTTADVTSITQTTASAGGNVVSDGWATVTDRGVCWSNVPYPTTSDNKTSDGSGTGPFNSSVTGLTASTTYYLRAFATNEKGTSYGDEKSFKTQTPPNLPTVTTALLTNITQTSVTTGGTVLTDGGSPVSARGVCWATTANPTVAGSHTSDGSGLGGFVSSITGLTPNTKYYVRAYATNGVGTSYGNEISFTSGQTTTAPVVTTTDVVNVAQTTATCGGNITSDGGSAVTARGVCWGTSTNPTTANSKTLDGTGTGGYLSSMTGLTVNTTYYVRAYATNSIGTSYGNEKTFTTLPEITAPAVTTAPVTNITNHTATSGGTVTFDGGANVTARGVCWSTGYNPTIADTHTSNGTGTGSFVSQMTELQANTFYRVRAYATNSAGTSYGNQQTFSTNQDPVLPTVTTAQAINITTNSATTGGTVMSDGGASVTARGVCYSTTPNPTLANSFTTDGSGTGTFVSLLNGLTPNTLYFVRAYATNSVGTAYGNEIMFTTLAAVTLPTVTTDQATNITQTTATSGGSVTSDGGTTVTARGVCWSTTSNPTLMNSYTTDGSGTGAFISNITGLTGNTLYYVRAYATNSVGTAYGNEVSFTTTGLINTCPGIPTVTYEGKIYNTVQIGTQCWFRENLNVGTRINGSQNQTNNGIKEKYCYNDLESNCDVYGGLYQWDEAMQYMTIQGATGICPPGWHLPQEGEWVAFIEYLSPGSCAPAGGMVKEQGTIHWLTPNTGATNTSYFTALPGGYRSGGFGNIQKESMFISSTQYNSSNQHCFDLWYNSDCFAGAVSNKSNGFSIRCLKDMQTTNLPAVTTASATSITQTSATSGGNVTSDGGATVTVRGVCWSTSTNPTIAGNHTTDGSGMGSFVSNLTGLSANTLYYVRAYATNSVGTAYGNEISFMTQAFSIGQSYGGGIIFYVDGTGQHGLISATSDQSTGAQWGCYATYIGTSTTIGTGQVNTTAIVNGCNETGIAAKLCDNLVLNGYSDWFLPSKDELNQMYLQKNVIGNFALSIYWSSSESASYAAWCQYFTNGSQIDYAKNSPYFVRAIRAF